MNASVSILFLTLATSWLAYAGGGYWAPSKVCETENHGMTVAWSYVPSDPANETLVGREFDIQLSGEEVGLPYLATASHPGNEIISLTLTARSGWADPAAVFPLGKKISLQLDRQWRSAQLTAEDGRKYLLTCE